MAKRLIALTGKTGAGKSTVSRLLGERGAYIIDGDKVSREVLVTEPTLKPKLQNAFGSDIYDGDELNRALLARRAFCNEKSTELLNSIFHPVVNARMSKLSEKAFSDYEVVIVDAAAIIESGFYKKCDMLITVTAPESVRQKRIMERDGLSAETALLRMNAQKCDEFYTDNADIIIKNYEPFDLKEQIDGCLKEVFGE